MSKKFSKDTIRSFIVKNFSFESDIDLSNEVEVLFRRNVVIKNLVLVSNLVYSFLLFVITIGTDDPGAWLYSFIPLPITFIMNKSIKKLVYTDQKELIRQQIAMHISSFYIFLSAILLYLKLSFGNTDLKEAGYMLLFYSLIVVSLYQNRKLLKNVFAWMLAIVTVIHVTITYPIIQMSYSSDFITFFKEFPKTAEFRDIFFRTVIMGCFMLVVYSICVIGEKMSQARNEELLKRQEIQQDFTGIVTNLFDVLINSGVNNSNDYENSIMLAEMSRKLASSYGFNPSRCEQLAEHAMFLDKHQNDFKINSITSDSEDTFDILRKQSKLGTELVRRIELANKTVNIIRTHVEGNDSPEFVNKMKKIQDNIDAEIILLADIYIALRRPLSFKRPYSHAASINLIKDELYRYFDVQLLDRFIKFQYDFEKIFSGSDD